MKYKPSCVKCKKKYDSDEPDDYYCSNCEKIKNAIAIEVDKKLAMMPRKKKPMSDLQRYDAINKEKQAKGGFVNIKDLGISL